MQFGAVKGDAYPSKKGSWLQAIRWLRRSPQHACRGSRRGSRFANMAWTWALLRCVQRLTSCAFKGAPSWRVQRWRGSGQQPQQPQPSQGLMLHSFSLRLPVLLDPAGELLDFPMTPQPQARFFDLMFEGLCDARLLLKNSAPFSGAHRQQPGTF